MKVILDWLRNTFGACNDRWRHAWEYQGENNRSCPECGARQVVVGHYSFMDADPMKQWEEVYAEEISEKQTDGRTGS